MNKIKTTFGEFCVERINALSTMVFCTVSKSQIDIVELWKLYDGDIIESFTKKSDDKYRISIYRKYILEIGA